MIFPPRPLHCGCARVPAFRHIPGLPPAERLAGAILALEQANSIRPITALGQPNVD